MTIKRIAERAEEYSSLMFFHSLTYICLCVNLFIYKSICHVEIVAIHVPDRLIMEYCEMNPRCGMLSCDRHL